LAVGAISAPVLARLEALDGSLAAAAKGNAFDSMRGQYMLREGLTYLNHASIGTVPRVVHDAHVAYLEICESHPHVYVWEEVWRNVTEETRKAAAALLRCDAEDVSITHSTTEGFNVLAHGLDLGAGQEVLYSTLNHSGASGAWEGLAGRRGYSVRRFDFPVDRGPGLSADEVVALHMDQIRPETRVLVFPHIDNMIGLRHPMAELAKGARARGVDWVFVDGAQSAGMIPLDLGASGVDAYAMSPHKWVQSPKGLGLFWTTPRLREAVPRLWMKGSQVAKGGRAYEDYSTRAWPGVVALGDALSFQSALGEAQKEARYRTMHERLRNRVEAERGLTWHSPTTWEDGSMIVSLGVRGRAAAEVGPLLLADHDIGVRAFGGALNSLRVSPNTLNTDQELDRLLDVLAGMAG
jgi:selenocysteine lyase/cysteine desulfurase